MGTLTRSFGSRLGAFGLVVALAPTLFADDISLVVTPGWASLTRSETMVFTATDCGEVVTPDWSVPPSSSVIGFPIVLPGGELVGVPAGVGEDTVTAADPSLLLGDGTATMRVLPPASLAITSARYRDHEQPSKVRFTARGFLDSGVVANTVVDEGDVLWPFTFEESMTSTLFINGVSSGAIVELPSKGKARRFTSVEGEVSLKLIPTSAPSRFRFSLRVDKHPLDSDDEITIVFEHGDFLDATGTVALTDGRFSSRKQAPAIGEPDLVVLAARAKLGDGASDKLKLIVATTTFTDTPAVPEDVRLCIGDDLCFSVDADDFVVKGARWIFASKESGVRRLVVDTKRQLVTLRLAGAELEAWPGGVVITSLRLDIGSESRKIGMIASSSGSALSF